MTRRGSQLFASSLAPSRDRDSWYERATTGACVHESPDLHFTPAPKGGGSRLAMRWEGRPMVEARMAGLTLHGVEGLGG